MGGAILQAVSEPLAFFLPIAAAMHCIRIVTSRLNESVQLCMSSARDSFARRVEIVLDIFLKILTPIDDIVGIILKQGTLIATYVPF